MQIMANNQHATYTASKFVLLGEVDEAYTSRLKVLNQINNLLQNHHHHHHHHRVPTQFQKGNSLTVFALFPDPSQVQVLVLCNV